MEGYFNRQFPHHLQETMACTTYTPAFSHADSTAEAMGLRYHPYICRTNYPRGHLSEGSDQYGSGNGRQLSACAYSGRYQQHQTITDDMFSRVNMPHVDLSQYLASDVSQLSTLKTLQDVCGLGVASTRLNDAVWLSGNAKRNFTQRSVKQSNEIRGAYNDHPFYNRRRRAEAPEDGMTRTRDKYRIVYTDKQRKGLEQAYEENKFITMETRNKLSKELNLSDRQIKIWFQNRRAKERRDSKRSSAEESSTSDSDQSTSSDFIDNVSVTSSCRFGGNETDSAKNTSPISQNHNVSMTTDRYLGYKTVPPIIDFQSLFSTRWGYSSGHDNLEMSTNSLSAQT